MPLALAALQRTIEYRFAIDTNRSNKGFPIPAKHLDFTLIIDNVKPRNPVKIIKGRRLPHRRPVATEVTNVHREVNNLIIHRLKKNANAPKYREKLDQ